MADFAELRSHLSYLTPDEVQQVESSWALASELHEGQYRANGDPYITHPLEVTRTLAEIHMDCDTLRAALLHDVLEDTETSTNWLETRIGTSVTRLVEGLSKLKSPKTTSRESADGETFRRFSRTLSEDVRVGIIKLYDRLHNIRTLDSLPPEKQARIAQQTLDLYSPLALQLGMDNLRIELEERCFKILHPIRARQISKASKRSIREHERLFQTAVDRLKPALEPLGITAEFHHRQLHTYSLHQRATQGAKIKQLLSQTHLQIIVETETQCYQALGCLNSLFSPMTNSFSDFIAAPKPNGYRSLHTRVYSAKGEVIRVQVRTHTMHHLAHHGLTWYWMEKRGQEALEATRPWVSDLVHLSDITDDHQDYLSSVKLDMRPDKLQVFSRKGGKYNLPPRATVLDFAYAVSSDLGNYCGSCRINGQPSPITQELKSGDQIIIVRSRTATVSRAWLDYVVTAKARNTIKQRLNKLTEREALRLGKRLLHSALLSQDTSLRRINANMRKETCQLLNYASFDDVLMDIGLGQRNPELTAAQLLGRTAAKSHTQLEITGTEGLLVNYAECCMPVPGDAITGIQNPSEGLEVHHARCPSIRAQSRGLISLTWCEKISNKFPTNIIVTVRDIHSVLANITSCITNSDINISGVHYKADSTNQAQINYRLDISNRDDLKKIMRKLRKIDTVHSARRQYKVNNSGD